MIIDLNELRLREKPLEVDSDFDDDELYMSGQLASLRKPVHAKLSVSLAGDRVSVRGEMTAALSIVCCRCAHAYSSDLDKAFDLDYWPDPEVSRENEEIELEYGDLDVGFYRDGVLDLSAVISEQIVLEIPMKPVCRENCKGLCARCGADLNEDKCDCGPGPLDPRLEALRDIKKQILQ